MPRPLVSAPRSPTRLVNWGTLVSTVPATPRPMSPSTRVVFEGSVIVVCAAVLLRGLVVWGVDGPWSPVARALDFTADPPFRHRVLFVWIANAARTIIPSLTPFESYFLSQVPAVLLAVGLVRLWVGRFATQRIGWVSSILLTVMMAPTITYRTFYDFGIVATFASGLILALDRRTWLLALVVVVGTLNHEITMLLIPAFVALQAGRTRPSWIATWTGVFLVLHLATRLGLFLAMPVDRFWHQGKLAYNLGLVTGLQAPLLLGLGPFAVWCLAGVARLPRVSPALRRVALLQPLLVVEVMLVGQLNESRQFDAFLPVLVAILVQGTQLDSGNLGSAAGRRSARARLR